MLKKHKFVNLTLSGFSSFQKPYKILRRNLKHKNNVCSLNTFIPKHNNHFKLNLSKPEKYKRNMKNCKGNKKSEFFTRSRFGFGFIKRKNLGSQSVKYLRNKENLKNLLVKMDEYHQNLLKERNNKKMNPFNEKKIISELYDNIPSKKSKKKHKNV